MTTFTESGKPMKSVEVSTKPGIEKAAVYKAIQVLKKEERLPRLRSATPLPGRSSHAKKTYILGHDRMRDSAYRWH